MVAPFYPVVVRQLPDEEGGGFIAQVIDLVGCMASGETPHRALGNVHIAMTEWLREARRLGREIPEPNAIVAKASQARVEASDIIARQRELIRAQAALIDQQSAELAALRAGRMADESSPSLEQVAKQSANARAA